MLSTAKLHSALLISGLTLLTAPAIANDIPPVPIPTPSEDFVFSPIDDYAPSTCTGQISNTFNPSQVEQQIASLTQNFSQALDSILSTAQVETCSAVSSTLSETTQNINYLHESKGVYKVITSAEPTASDEENYIYTFDVLSVRYIPYTEETELDMAASSMLNAVGGTCTLDDLSYPYEADCTFAITDEANSRLSVGKLRYSF